MEKNLIGLIKLSLLLPHLIDFPKFKLATNSFTILFKSSFEKAPDIFCLWYKTSPFPKSLNKISSTLIPHFDAKLAAAGVATPSLKAILLGAPMFSTSLSSCFTWNSLCHKTNLLGV